MVYADRHASVTHQWNTWTRLNTIRVNCHHWHWSCALHDSWLCAIHLHACMIQVSRERPFCFGPGVRHFELDAGVRLLVCLGCLLTLADCVVCAVASVLISNARMCILINLSIHLNWYKSRTTYLVSRKVPASINNKTSNFDQRLAKCRPKSTHHTEILRSTMRAHEEKGIWRQITWGKTSFAIGEFELNFSFGNKFSQSHQLF